MFNGRIQVLYFVLPSIEDKIHRFADKEDSHQMFGPDPKGGAIEVCKMDFSPPLTHTEDIQFAFMVEGVKFTDMDMQ
jgi:tRNA U34 5-carboxymethylaminomethyl modifying enzyme MnmG/GidA